MPGYYQGIRDEYGNRDYARNDGFADRLYGPHDPRGRSPEDDIVSIPVLGEETAEDEPATDDERARRRDR